MLGKVDVVVGGQYGDEGKGQVALTCALSRQYAVFVRTGGENAEHRVVLPDGRQACHHILPVGVECGTGHYRMAVLAAGMTFSLRGLEREVGAEPIWENLRDGSLKVLIDRNAAIITDDLREAGRAAALARGSTFLGVGATMAEKVRRAGGCQTASDHKGRIGALPGVLVCETVPILHRALAAGGDILLEGSQGTMLSLDHGHYPFCTSRNVTAMGALSDAGLNWESVRRVIMVVKAIPTRVPGSSGPTGGQEMTWEQVCFVAGMPYTEIRQTPLGADGAGDGAGGLERPFEISDRELLLAARLNGATEIVLTFLDWWCYIDRGIREWEHLSDRSKSLVQRVEDATGVRVSAVRTGPQYEDVVWVPPPPYGDDQWGVSPLTRPPGQWVGTHRPAAGGWQR